MSQYQQEIDPNTFTTIMLANQRGSDSPPDPVAVHGRCWNTQGLPAGYERGRPGSGFVYMRVRYEAIQANMEVLCYFCKEQI